MKKYTKKIIITTGVSILFIGALLLVQHLGALQKRKVSIEQLQINYDQQSGNSIQKAGNDQLSQPSSEIEQQVPNDQQPETAAKQPSQSQSPVNQAAEEKSVSHQSEQSSNAPAKSSNSNIVARLISWGFQKSSGRSIDTVIVHTSYDAEGNDPYNVDGVIAEWKAAGVAPHYLIARDGTVYQLVADQNIAWHAGVSKMPDGRTNVNDFSIGVEMINTLDGKFTDAQYSTLNQLIVTLKQKYSIKYVLGHDDIAPGRKTDPWGMDWSKVRR